MRPVYGWAVGLLFVWFQDTIVFIVLVGGPETSHGAKRGHRNEAPEGHPWGQGQGGDDWGHEGHPQVEPSNIGVFVVNSLSFSLSHENYEK